MNIQHVRQKVAERFSKTLGSDDLGKKLEIVLWNDTLRGCQRDHIELEWNSSLAKSFRERYTLRAINLDVYNLKTNEKLRDALTTGDLGLKKFIGMKPWEMNPDLWTPIFERVAFKALRRQTTPDAENAPDGAFTCGKCKSKKTTYYQLQTRSADVKFTRPYKVFTFRTPHFPNPTVSHHIFCRAHDDLYPVSELRQTMEAMKKLLTLRYMQYTLIALAIAVVVVIVVLATKPKGKKLTVISDGSRRIVIENGAARLSSGSGGLVTTSIAVKDTKDGIYSVGGKSGYLSRSGDKVVVSTDIKKSVWVFAFLPQGTAIGALNSNGDEVFLAPFKDSLIMSPTAYYWSVNM